MMKHYNYRVLHNTGCDIILSRNNFKMFGYNILEYLCIKIIAVYRMGIASCNILILGSDILMPADCSLRPGYSYKMTALYYLDTYY